MHCSPDLGEHIYDHCLELFYGKLHISISLRSVSGDFSFVWNIVLFLNFIFLTLCVGFHVLEKTAPFTSLERWSRVGMDLLNQPSLSSWFSLKPL